MWSAVQSRPEVITAKDRRRKICHIQTFIFIRFHTYLCIFKMYFEIFCYTVKLHSCQFNNIFIFIKSYCKFEGQTVSWQLCKSDNKIWRKHLCVSTHMLKRPVSHRHCILFWETGSRTWQIFPANSVTNHINALKFLFRIPKSSKYQYVVFIY